MARLLLVEPNTLICRALAPALAADPAVAVVAAVATAEAARQHATQHALDLVVTEVALPDGSGLALTEELQRLHPAPHVLVMSPHVDGLCAERALRAGASGYVCQDEPVEVVLEAVYLLLAGHLFVSRVACDELLQAVAARQEPIMAAPPEVLSPREQEYFELVGQGLSSAEVAERMEVATATIKSYARRTKCKLQVRRKSELVHLAMRWHREQRVCYCQSAATTR